MEDTCASMHMQRGCTPGSGHNMNIHKQPHEGMHAYAGGNSLASASAAIVHLQETLLNNLAAHWPKRAHQGVTGDNATALCCATSRCQSFQCEQVSVFSQYCHFMAQPPATRRDLHCTMQFFLNAESLAAPGPAAVDTNLQVLGKGCWQKFWPLARQGSASFLPAFCQQHSPRGPR